ncbi:MAG: L-ribulose-5-phosphate 3-epimerase [Brevinema sp.]
MTWIGLYEKAIPKEVSWEERLRIAKELGFDFMEISIDESDEKLARLEWTLQQKRELMVLSQDLNLPILSMCLSGHRRYPFGSANKDNVKKARWIFDRALDFALHFGIRNIQLAGYDVYYEESTPQSRSQFKDELMIAVEKAAARQIMLSIEIMDSPFINSIHRYAEITKEIYSPWLTVYPDIGNMTAWGDNVSQELTEYISQISAIHLKDTLPVTPDFPGQFRDLILGEGSVDFERIFRVLKSLNYQGSFVLELWALDDNYKENIIKSKDFIIQKMKNVYYHLK